MFKKEANTTFSKILSKIRIERARDLLRESDLRIQEVAEAVGYNDTNYFTKIFKKGTGITPKEYQSLFKFL